MNHTFRFSRNKLLAVLAVIPVIALVATGLYALKCWEFHDGFDDSSETSNQDDYRAEYYFNGQKYVLNDYLETILFLGVDEHETTISDTNVNATQADLLMLYVFDHDKETYTALQINRDTMTDIQLLTLEGDVYDTEYAQIALSHAYGDGGKASSLNTLEAASGLLFDTEIDHYVTIRMDAIPVLNDVVGGVTVELLDDFTSLNDEYTKGATVTLKGDEATAYVQYRAQLEDSSNVSRMERQKQYMSAWSEQVKAKMQQDEGFVGSTLLELADYFLTDITVNHIDVLADHFAEYTFNGVLDIPGDAPEKGEQYMEFHCDEAALQQMIIDLFYIPVQ